MSVCGPGRVKKAPYLRHPQNAAVFASPNSNFPWKPFSERPLKLPGASVGADLNAQILGLGCHGCQQPGHADDRHHALHVIGEHIERHLG
jgi:hypothetical protein